MWEVVEAEARKVRMAETEKGNRKEMSEEERKEK